MLSENRAASLFEAAAGNTASGATLASPRIMLGGGLWAQAEGWSAFGPHQYRK